MTIGVATLAIAWLFSQISPAWTTRYLGVALGPIFLLAAFGLSRAGYLGMVALVIILGIWAIPKTAGLENKSNVSDLAAAADPAAEEGRSGGHAAARAAAAGRLQPQGRRDSRHRAGRTRDQGRDGLA
ncbi:MAG: hypothetical protein WKF40_02435 [Thermoleophilaceae bacterium]